MAEEEEKTEDEKKGDSGKKSNLMIIIIVAFLVLLLVLGGVVMFIFAGGDDEMNNKQNVQTEASANEENPEQPTKSYRSKSSLTVGPMFELDTFIVNLLSENGRRYLKVKINLELSDEELTNESLNRQSHSLKRSINAEEKKISKCNEECKEYPCTLWALYNINLIELKRFSMDN